MAGRQAGMDYLELAEFTTHRSFPHFLESGMAPASRLVLLTN